MTRNTIKLTQKGVNTYQATELLLIILSGRYTASKMTQIIKSKLLWFSVILLIFGIAFGYFENTYYQYIDENNVLIESWFMPLSFLCIFIGSLGLIFVAVKATWLALKKSA